MLKSLERQIVTTTEQKSFGWSQKRPGIRGRWLKRLQLHCQLINPTLGNSNVMECAIRTELFSQNTRRFGDLDLLQILSVQNITLVHVGIV